MRPMPIALAPLLLSLAGVLACSDGGGGGSADLADLESDLLATGSQVPDVTLIRMDEDDSEFQLASLQGKTLLLNFWFYH